jgi:tetratricopeptide (TPR) repeat protein
METRDIATLTIGCSALLLSLVALVQKLFETRRTIRLQLTESISESMSVLADVDVQRYKRDELKDREAEARLNRLTKQLYSLAVQADFFMQKLPAKMIRDVEYSNVANAFWASDDHHRAQFYFEKAVAAAEDRHEPEGEEWYFNLRTAKCVKEFANLLFQRGKQEEGRRQYEKAAGLLRGERDQVWMEKGWVFMMWARSEARVGQKERALEYKSQAKKAFEAIKNKEMRKKSLRDLEDKLSPHVQQEVAKEPSQKS